MGRRKSIHHKSSILIGSISGVAIGLVVGLLVLVFEYPIREYQNSPRIAYEIQSTQFPETCPKTINFGNSLNANFNVKYKNIGKANGDVAVTAYSDKVRMRVEGTQDEFTNAASRLWTIEIGRVEDYKFKLKKDSSTYIGNLTMVVYESCQYDTSIKLDKSCGTMKLCCNYKRVASNNNFVFVDTKCDSVPPDSY
ncbi:MAG: hypothetical protein V1837_00340 [Candidatus Woesearchaeota archaeon]